MREMMLKRFTKFDFQIHTKKVPKVELEFFNLAFGSIEVQKLGLYRKVYQNEKFKLLNLKKELKTSF